MRPCRFGVWSRAGADFCPPPPNDRTIAVFSFSPCDDCLIFWWRYVLCYFFRVLISLDFTHISSPHVCRRAISNPFILHCLARLKAA